MAITKTVVVEKDEDGWWAYYADGWKSSTDTVGAQHTDHADTKREIMRLVRSAIPCNCKQCTARTCGLVDGGNERPATSPHEKH